MRRKSFLVDFAAVIVATLVLLWLWHSMISNLNDSFKKVDDDYNTKVAVNLSDDTDKDILSAIIQNNLYAENKTDADFIAGVIVDRVKKMDFHNLYIFQERKYGQVSAAMADSCGVLSEIYKKSCKDLGQTGHYEEYKPTEKCSGKIKVEVTIPVENDSLSMFKKIFSKIFSNEKPSVGDTVRLLKYYRDSLSVVQADTLGFVLTDSTGVALFNGLDTSASYSVLPIKKGFEYGAPKGTTKGKLAEYNEGEADFSFKRKEHLIPLFSKSTLRQIRKDKTITVRTPEEFKAEVVKWFVSVIIGWWLLCFILIMKRKKFNGLLVASGLFLTGLSVLMMFSIQDPLTDELHGSNMASGVLIGVFVTILLLFVDFEKFYQNRYRLPFDMPLCFIYWLFFKQYKDKVAGITSVIRNKSERLPKKIFYILCWIVSLPLLVFDMFQLFRLGDAYERMCVKLPRGIGWLFLALIITALLLVPGIGEAVGGMKVNINLFGFKFQPSEIAKYLILFSIAAFFTTKADNIIAYSQKAKTLGKKIKSLLWVIIGLFVLMGLYMRLGDMGPGLVIGITFILLYSIIISKVNLDGVDEEGKWKRIFTCDFAMLVYGVLSFAGFVILGMFLGNALYFGILWFVLWVVVGLLHKKQIYETALLMNLIIFIFIFGGEVMNTIPGLKGRDTVERFEKRTEMCKNPWGDLDIEYRGYNAKPVSNDQVASGLWGLASGGMGGQGLAKGNPNVIPAYHTDMILSSIGEQLGWFGLFAVVIALGIMIWKIMWVGHGSGHPFTFYLCMGFAIVISVQFFIIALGSSGMIPLTGVTVPFLSYGRVSMILNIVALGIVISISQKQSENETNVAHSKSTEQYGYPIAIISLVFIILAFSTLMVWQFYQLWNRSKTIVHPVYVLSKQGEPIIEYNPRINLIMQNMYAGRIYDRNGVLLATSETSEIDTKFYEKEYGMNKDSLDLMLKRRLSRFYPFGEHLFFMLGDMNNGIYFTYNEYTPVGYMAEAQHLSYLRGFDNVYRDEDENPVRLIFTTDKLKDNPYLDDVKYTTDPIVLRDYSDLVPFLEDGIGGEVLFMHNFRVKCERCDLHLTIDSKLQYDLQNRIAEYVGKTDYLKINNLLRISVVVLDAKDGDLLASANYPLPDYKRLLDEEDLARKAGKRFATYSDSYKDKEWNAYTDRDLGTTYQTFPGSTAKVMSAMAGLMKIGESVTSQTYRITSGNQIEIGIEPTGDKVSMCEAIVKSSNCYFVNLVNDKDLFWDLDSIYIKIGVSVGQITPYYFKEKNDTSWKEKFYEKIAENRMEALRKYDLFNQGKLKKDKKGNYITKDNTNMSIAEWKWAWGQGYEGFELQASPLNMARVASAVVNGGKLRETEYLMGENGYEKENRSDDEINLLSKSKAKILKEYMLAESANRGVLPSYVGGKSGTPERGYIFKSKKEIQHNDTIIKYCDERHNVWTKEVPTKNDGWYIFFVEGDAKHNPLAVAVRMERLQGKQGSGQAVKLANEVVLKVLEKEKYIKGN